jgi:leucyl-tRNA synthetase
MFAAPPEQSLDWNDSALEGAYKFLKRLWKYFHEFIQKAPLDILIKQTDYAYTTKDELKESQKKLRFKLHNTISKVSDDLSRRNAYNTAIASIMELLNALYGHLDTSTTDNFLKFEVYKNVIIMLSPIVPHFCHNLWYELGFKHAVIDEPWPQIDFNAIQQETLEIIVQVNGKLRAQLKIAKDTAPKELEKAALANEKISKFIAHKEIKKIIIVANKLVNIVI